MLLLSVPLRSAMDLPLPIPQGHPMPNTMQKALHFFVFWGCSNYLKNDSSLWHPYSCPFWRNWQENQRFLWRRDEASTPYSKIWSGLLSRGFIPLPKLWSLCNDGEFQNFCFVSLLEKTFQKDSRKYLLSLFFLGEEFSPFPTLHSCSEKENFTLLSIQW